MAEQFVNQVPLTLGLACGATDTTLTLAGSGLASLPTSGTYSIIVDAEIMTVTGLSGAVATVVRGAEGSGIAAHLAGATVILGMTAGTMARFKADVGTAPLGTASVGGAKGTEAITDYAASPFPGDGAWHTIATITPALQADECREVFVSVNIRRTVGTAGAIRIRRVISVQNVAGVLQGIDGTNTDHAVDTYGTAGVNGAPTGAAAQIVISGTSLLVQAQATQSFHARCAFSVDGALAPGTVAGPTTTAISPSYAASTAAPAVTITGSNYAGATDAGVKVGATKYSLTGLAVTGGGTQITGHLPSAPIGKGFAYVTVGGVDYVSSVPYWFLNAAGPSADVAISPTNGPVAGGTTVTVTATSGLVGLDIPGYGVTLNGVAATVVSVASDASATITSAAGTGGPGAVIVSTPTGTRTSSSTWSYASDASTIFGTSGMDFWYRGDSIAQTSGTLTGWTDKSPNGKNQTIAGGAPGYVASSTHSTPAQPSVSFGGSDSLSCAAVGNGGSGHPACVLIVAYLADTTARNLLSWPIGASGFGLAFFTSVGASGKPQVNTQAGNAVWSGATINGATKSIVGSVDGVVGTSVSSIDVSNGTANTVSGTAGATVASATLTISPLTPFSGHKGEIFEVVGLNFIPTPTQLSQWETYCQAQYGSTV